MSFSQTAEISLSIGHFANRVQLLYEGTLRELKWGSKRFGLNNLREANLAASETEVRLWIGFGLLSMRFFRLNTLAENHEAFFITVKQAGGKAALDRHGEFSYVRTKLAQPLSGWDDLTSFMKAQGIEAPLRLALDPDYEPSPDEEVIVVEVKAGSSYSMVYFSLPPQTADGHKVTEVCQKIEREFTIRMGCGR